MPNRVLIRHDGSKVVVPDAEADKLLTLGYREQTAGEELGEGIERGREDFYSSGTEKLKTIGEGALSGATLGLSDLVLDSEATKDRARYNPGTRIASELVGGLATGELGSAKYVGKVARWTPAGLLTRGAEAAGTLAKGSKVISTMVRGGVEGAGLGANAAITTAKMEGDPLTGEAILAGIGWGTLFGGGLAGLGGVVQAKMESRAAKKLLESEAVSTGEVLAKNTLERAESSARVQNALTDGMKESHAAAALREEGHYQAFASQLSDATTQLKGIELAVNEAKEINFSGLNRSQVTISSKLADTGDMLQVRAEARNFNKQFSLAQQAAKDGNYAKMVEHLESFKQNMAVIEGKLAPFFSAEKVVGQANDLIGLAKLRLENASRASEFAVSASALHSSLSKFPKTADEFIKMTPGRVEKLSASVDQLGKLKAAELAGVQEAVKDAVGHMAQGLGLKIEGTPGAQLQGMWKLLKDTKSARAKELLQAGQQGNLLWNKVGKAEESLSQARMRGGEIRDTIKKGPRGPLNQALGYGVGAWASSKMGYGPAGAVAFGLGKNLVTGLLGLKGAVLGTLSEKAAKWVPRAAKATIKYGPRVEPLLTRIDGSQDSGSREELMRARAKEINEAAPTVRDTIFRAVQPLNIEHPELAATIHAHAVARFQFLLSKLPKDPGRAFSRLKSLWKPDQVQTEKFSRYYEVFQNPVAVAVEAMETGKITLEAAEGLREMNPELWTQVRSNLLFRISEPEVLAKMSYEDQVHMSILLGINLHSTLTPEFISAQQQMFTERNKPLEMNPRIQPGGGAGRPSGPGPSATAAQRITEH